MNRKYEELGAMNLEGRELEASVLLRAARKLNHCANNWSVRETPEFREELNEALAFVQRLWSFLQVEISDGKHALPPTTRSSLFHLSCYVDKTVMKLYADGTLQDLKSLININNEIAGGLMGGNSAAEPASDAAALATTADIWA